MSDTAIPHYRCTSCLQEIPAEDRQYLFGSEKLCPQSDDAENFVTEAQKILRYSSAVAMMCNEAEKVGEDVVCELHLLLSELADEALRRLDRAQEALNVVWKRDEAAKKATHARKEGV